MNQHGATTSFAIAPGRQPTHDPEKCAPVFRKDHAQ